MFYSIHTKLFVIYITDTGVFVLHIKRPSYRYFKIFLIYINTLIPYEPPHNSFLNNISIYVVE